MTLTKEDAHVLLDAMHELLCDCNLQRGDVELCKKVLAAYPSFKPMFKHLLVPQETAP